MTRAAQREETRTRIVAAALDVFAEVGYEAASTRLIAQRAGVTQGLLTYHYRSKDELWRAAADRIFELAAVEAVEPAPADGAGPDRDRRWRAREGVRRYVHFAARHPAVFRFMIDAQSDPGGRCAWLVETHLRPMYEPFARRIADIAPEHPTTRAVHVFYTMVGAGSALFSLAEEAKRLSGIDVDDPATIDAHADFVARLLVPETAPSDERAPLTSESQ